MTGFDHGAHSPRELESEPPSSRRVRYGRALFAFYLLLYGGFVLLNAFDPAMMERTPFAGVNLAVLYGLALIATAFFLALVYDWLCRVAESRRGRNMEDGK